MPCSTASLVSAITAANTAVGATTLQLSSNCTYTLFTAAAPGDGLPVIANDITLAGLPNTVIRRSSAAPLFRLIEVGTAGDLTVSNVSLMNGNTTSLGGGILDAGTLVVTSSRISGNKASNGGGVSVSAVGSATIASTLMNLNTTTGVGGGAVIDFGTLRLVSSVLDSNTAPINGGGLNVQPGGNAAGQQTTFTNNTSGGLGGGISNLGTLSLAGSQVRLNQASSGGGIATGNNNVTLVSTIIKKNTPNNCSPANTISGCVN